MSLAGRFGAHIRIWREMAGLTQAQMSEKLNVNRVTIAKWEAGDASSVTLGTVEKALAVMHPDWDMADLSPAWRAIIADIGAIDETQVPAIITAIRVAIALPGNQGKGSLPKIGEGTYKKIDAFLNRDKTSSKLKKKV